MHILCPHCRNPIELVKLTPREEIACPACGSTFRLEGGATTGSEDSAGRKVGRFDLIETVGHGAFGTVFKARDPELDRVVAIKVPRTGNLAGPQELDRFLREARSVAQLRHPSIVSVHEVGQEDGVPYLVSEFFKGVTLADLLSARRPGFREAAELVAAVADALQYAHERGVVHRDVKPSNIMIGDNGTPCVMDFGLAKREAGEITMTVEGQVLGTPAYMPPEQARGEGHAVDARGDVYSLGVVLYELLTGELPFRGTQRMLLHQVLHDEPRAPRSLNDHIPRDLQTITLKAMAKEPGRRYAAARNFADDLRRWLNGEPIQARPVGQVERVVRWVRRRPAAAGLLAVSGVTVLALVGVVVGLVYNARLSDAYDAEAAARRAEEEQRKQAEAARQAEEEQRKNAEGARDLARTALKEREMALKERNAALELADRTAYFHSVFLADMALKENNLLRAQQRLQECKAELRNWEWRYMDAQCHANLFSFSGSGPAFSPDGSRIAIEPPRLSRDGVVRVYDARTGREVLALKGPAPLGRPVFSPDGTLIAVAPPAVGDGVVRLYDAQTGQEALALKGPAGFRAPVFSPDSSRIAIAPPIRMTPPKPGRGAVVGAVVRVYDSRTGQEALSLQGPAGARAVTPVFSPDGSRVAVASLDGAHADAVLVYDSRKGQELFALKAPAALYNPVFSPDGSRIATDCGDGVVRVYDGRTGQEALALRGGASGLGTPVFSPDGSRIAASGGGVVRMYDGRTGQEAFALRGPARLGSPVFSPDGSHIAADALDGLVRVYDTRTHRETLALKAPAQLDNPVFSPDGASIAASGGDSVVRIYDARANLEALDLKALVPLGSPVFSPDGTRIAVTTTHLYRDGVLRVYDVQTAQQILAIKGAQALSAPVFSPGAPRVAVGGDDGVVRVYDGRTGQEVFALKAPAALYNPVFSPDGARIIAAEGSGSGMRMYDAKTGQEVLALTGGGRLGPPVLAGAPVFSPDGARVAVGGGEGVVRVYDSRTGQEALVLKAPEALGTRAVFSPDGSRIAVAPARLQRGGVVRVYDAQAGQEVCALQGASGLSAPVFSPGGARIAVGGNDGSVRVYDCQTGQEAFALQSGTQLSAPVSVFSPDGSRIAVCGPDGVVRVYDGRTGQEILVIRGASGFRDPVFSPDGSRIAVGGWDGVVRVLTAPIDADRWQAERRDIFPGSLRPWHQAQSQEYERAGDWFAAVFHLNRLADTEPASGLLHYRRGLAFAHLARTSEAEREFERALSEKGETSELAQADANAQLAHWDAAAKHYARVIEASDGSAIIWYRHALLRLYLDDRAGYAMACSAIVKRFGKSGNPKDASTTAWSCAVGSGALRDLQLAVEAARRAVSFDGARRAVAVGVIPRDATANRTLGAILYRAGQDTEAVKSFNDSIQLNPAGGTTLDFLFLAMAHHRLGKPAEARSWLEKATQAHANQPPVFWVERLEWQLLHREAEALLKEPPPDPKK